MKLSRELRVGLGEDLVEDVSIGVMGFVGATEFKGEFTGGSDEGDFAGLKDETFVSTGHTDDLVVRDRDHGFLFDDKALVVEDDAPVGDANEAGATAFAIENGID